MTRHEYEREQFLTALDDIGIGFRKGKPIVPKSFGLRLMQWATGVSVGCCAIALLALVWSRLA